MTTSKTFRLTIAATAAVLLAALLIYHAYSTPERNADVPATADTTTAPQDDSGSRSTSTRPDIAAPPRNALQAVRIRETPDGARSVSRIQYDPPYFRAEDDAGVQIVDMEQQTLHFQTPDGQRRDIELADLDLAPQCAFFFGEFAPKRFGAVVVGETPLGNATCSVWEIPADTAMATDDAPSGGHLPAPPAAAPSTAKDDTVEQTAVPCPDLAGVRMTVCQGTPLPVRVELPNGVVERLESWTLLPAGSLREALAAERAEGMTAGLHTDNADELPDRPSLQ
ncbi:hypothetical protein [Oceanidesulfovibrio marinus]|uniref:Uncharacterized protein n=1 Tax=Oceanidesulfovibrio marinus TaxID=370038 RepID=A0A6P1ZMT1_9BACT|nr:hypothetical protein [Oceanidesulfovibrio marinus]TVM35667.1 hypothetical protein DQK91_03090 [Oceanidesulfovibrio marinus]